ncbi:zinc-ribbon domain-containing protein [Parvibaculum sp.]|jgi:predicted Zn finger-like uncharacterized protein|uniref:zinc-ribbon domain-containing protein n=1 Tax=Parvibaculum sp. TaxID=2024848 RepID=UPI002FD8A2BC
MIITCPSCAARYPVDAASFEPSGRKVRCAKCGNSWHQEPQSAEAPPPAGEALPPVGSPVRKKIFGEKPKADAVTDAAPEAVKAEAVPDDADDVVFADEATPPAPKKSVTADIGNRFRAEVRRAASMRRGRVLIAAGWTVLALFVAGTLGGGWIYRDSVAAWWPATTKVYAAVGEEINLRGFEFRNVSYERQTEEGLPVLAITGEVVNVSGERAVLPRLRVGLLDEEQKELYHWTFALAETELPPSEATSFVTRLSSPPPESRDIEVRFVQETDVAAAGDVSGSDDEPATDAAPEAPAAE